MTLKLLSTMYVLGIIGDVRTLGIIGVDSGYKLEMYLQKYETNILENK